MMEFFVAGPLFTVNGERSMSHYVLGPRVKWWREMFYVQGVQNRPLLPLETPVRVIGQPYQSRGRLGDAGGHAPVLKAALDGLVDAHILPDDDGRYVAEITYRAPLRGPEGFWMALGPV